MVNLTTTKVYKSTRKELDDLKKELRLSSKADVIAYLVAHYRKTWGSISMLEDRQHRDQVEAHRSQMTIDDMKE